MSDLEVIRSTFELISTRGRSAGQHRSPRSPVVLDVFTEDAFLGRVRSEHDLVSEFGPF
jgi:hypothetical protein